MVISNFGQETRGEHSPVIDAVFFSSFTDLGKSVSSIVIRSKPEANPFPFSSIRKIIVTNRIHNNILTKYLLVFSDGQITAFSIYM